MVSTVCLIIFMIRKTRAPFRKLISSQILLIHRLQIENPFFFFFSFFTSFFLFCFFFATAENEEFLSNKKKTQVECCSQTVLTKMEWYAFLISVLFSVIYHFRIRPILALPKFLSVVDKKHYLSFKISPYYILCHLFTKSVLF